MAHQMLIRSPQPERKQPLVPSQAREQGAAMEAVVAKRDRALWWHRAWAGAAGAALAAHQNPGMTEPFTQLGTQGG